MGGGSGNGAAPLFVADPDYIEPLWNKLAKTDISRLETTHVSLRSF